MCIRDSLKTLKREDYFGRMMTFYRLIADTYEVRKWGFSYAHVFSRSYPPTPKTAFSSDKNCKKNRLEPGYNINWNLRFEEKKNRFQVSNSCSITFDSHWGKKRSKMDKRIILVLPNYEVNFLLENKVLEEANQFQLFFNSKSGRTLDR